MHLSWGGTPFCRPNPSGIIYLAVVTEFTGPRYAQHDFWAILVGVFPILIGLAGLISPAVQPRLPGSANGEINPHYRKLAAFMLACTGVFMAFGAYFFKTRTTIVVPLLPLIFLRPLLSDLGRRAAQTARIIHMNRTSVVIQIVTAFGSFLVFASVALVIFWVLVRITPMGSDVDQVLYENNNWSVEMADDMPFSTHTIVYLCEIARSLHRASMYSMFAIFAAQMIMLGMLGHVWWRLSRLSHELKAGG